ncbi:hypothetical protein C2E23DRAFT_59402 [Lenzites betulinus]|nr:hypothetical protein C2E23DRAFT_59402 [Lenzites betulinus]
MSAYYVPRRSHSVSRASASQGTIDHDHSGRQHDRSAPPGAVSTDQSIYIFPSPASAPPSPGTSISSAPTEFDFSFPSDSRSDLRTELHRSHVLHGARNGPTYCPSSETSPHPWDLPTPSDGDLEIEIGLWDTGSDFNAEPSDSDESWALEDEIERVGRADVGVPYTPRSGRARRLPLASPQTPDVPRTRYYCSVRARQRSRTRSRIRTTSISSLALSSSQQAPPHPRIQIPLLSFFSSLLSIDLDDPALRLLTTSEPGDAEAVLFPGQSSARLLEEQQQSPSRPSHESDSDTETESAATSELAPYESSDAEVHGLPKLLLSSISDHSATALRSLRAGLAVRIPAGAPDFALPLPSAAELVGLWRVFGEVYSKGSQAWKEMWTVAAGRTPLGGSVISTPQSARPR